MSIKSPAPLAFPRPMQPSTFTSGPNTAGRPAANRLADSRPPAFDPWQGLSGFDAGTRTGLAGTKELSGLPKSLAQVFEQLEQILNRLSEQVGLPAQGPGPSAEGADQDPSAPSDPSQGAAPAAPPTSEGAESADAGADAEPPTSEGAESTAGATGVPATDGNGQNKAFDIAKAHLGQNASSMKVGQDALGLAMRDGIPNDINCANFVSGCLEAAGQITKGEHDDSVQGLSAKLDDNPNFKRVSLAQAKPGDVVCLDTGEGQHVVMFAGMKDGKPQFIGSNNVNSDGSQKVTMSSMDYKILSIHQYQGQAA
jgi:hypothetical protein